MILWFAIFLFLAYKRIRAAWDNDGDLLLWGSLFYLYLIGSFSLAVINYYK